MTTYYIGIDPGFKKCGYAVIDQDGKLHEYNTIELRSESKLRQGHMDYTIACSVKCFMADIRARFRPTVWIIEQQLGQFSCQLVEAIMVANVASGEQFIVQNSRMKLKHEECKTLQPRNETSKKYNQNKDLGLQLAQVIGSYTQPDVKFNRDSADAFLHAMYFLRTIKDKKNDLIMVK